MKHLLCAAITALVVGVAPAAVAGNGPIQISATIPYASNAGAGPAIRAECKWNTELSAHIVKRAKGAVTATDADLDGLSGQVLRIEVTHAHALGGGGFTGPKWGRIYGELREDGQLVGNFSLHRTTGGRGALTACGALSKVAAALGEDVVEWLRHPTIDPNIGAPAAAPTAP